MVLPVYNQPGPYFVGPPAPGAGGAIQPQNPFAAAMQSPIFGLGVGLLGGAMAGRPGAGLQAGWQNMLQAQRADQATYLLGQRIAEMRRQRQERERLAQARENLRSQYPDDPRMQAMIDYGLTPGDIQQADLTREGITSREGIAERNLQAQALNRQATQALTAATQAGAQSHRETQFNRALSQQYTAENKQAQERVNRYRDIREFYGNEADMTGADDMKMIYSVAKMINPGEAIMQGDMDSIISAGGIPDLVKSFAQQVKGKGQLSIPARQQLLATARPLGDSGIADIQRRRAEYVPRFYNPAEAERWLGGFDPETYAPEPTVEDELMPSIEGRPGVEAARQRYLDSLDQSGFKAEDVEATDVQSVLEEIERRAVERRQRGRNR